MLMKLTPGVDFTNILQAAFLRKGLLKLFATDSLALLFFWQKNIGSKAACKMLIKLTPVAFFYKQ